MKLSTMKKLRKILSNKVLLYVGTRYVVYGIQFISLIILAAKLGQYNYGIWGFILMLINYLNILNFGIPNSINIIIVQFKKSILDIRNYISSAFVVISMLIGILVIIGYLYYLWPERIFTKYSIGSYFYLILIIGSFQYLNLLMVNIFRACNKLIEIAVYQSSIPLGVFTVAVLSKGENLIDALVWTYLLMNVCSLSFFLIRGQKFWGAKPSISCIKAVIGKGFFLFIYNASFYLILITTSTLVSKYFSVSEYGSYSFSYTLGHSILLLMEAFTYIVFPKVVDKFYIGDEFEIDRTLNSLRVNYISLAHGLIYFALMVFPVVINIFPQFKGSLMTLNLMMLAIVLSTNSFGYNTFLMARNKEKICAKISLFTLIINIIVGYVLIKCFTIEYYLMVVSIMISYLIFAALCSYFANKVLNKSLNIIQVVLSVLPVRLMIPYLVAIIITLINKPLLSFIPMMVFIIVNKSSCNEIFNTIKKVISRPQMIDIDN